MEGVFFGTKFEYFSKAGALNLLDLLVIIAVSICLPRLISLIELRDACIFTQCLLDFLCNSSLNILIII